MLSYFIYQFGYLTSYRILNDPFTNVFLLYMSVSIPSDGQRRWEDLRLVGGRDVDVVFIHVMYCDAPVLYYVVLWLWIYDVPI